MDIEKRLSEKIVDIEGILEIVREIPVNEWILRKSKVRGLEPYLQNHYIFIARYGKMVFLDRRGIYRIELKAPVPTAPRDWKDLAIKNPENVIMPLGEYTLTFSKGEKNHTEITTLFNGSIIFGDKINTAICREYKNLLVKYAKHFVNCKK